MAKHLTDWRHGSETPGLKEAPCHPLQHALKDLERAYKNFFAQRADFPRFKRKGWGESFRYPDPKQFEIDQANSRIKLPKLGWMRYRSSRDIAGEAKSITLRESGGRWFASIQTERELPQPVPAVTTAIGIDVGLARYQRRMVRKVKYSNNWKKQKAKVQKIHTASASARKDFLPKTTSTISQNHALVCLEDLQVKNMSRSAKGRSEQPGKRLRQKAGLNRCILDQGWAEFRRQLAYRHLAYRHLAYKMDWSGGVLRAVPAQHTSPCCGHVGPETRRTQQQFQCVACGYAAHADVVGAVNIPERGQRSLACGEDGSGRSRKTAAQPASVKQEPAEATMQEAAHA